MKIMLDAGHAAKQNQSPINAAYFESEVMWSLQAFLKEELENYADLVVSTTRSKADHDPEAYMRGTLSKGYNLFISLHTSAAHNDMNIDQPTVIAPLSGKADALAAKLADQLHFTMRTSQLGSIYKRAAENSQKIDYYPVLRGAASVNTSMALIVNHSFHTNPQTVKYLLSAANLRLLAKAEAKTIAEYFNLKIKELTPISGKSTVSAVQLAKFLLKTNAEPKINCSAIELAEYFITEGDKLNIRGDIAFCQAIHETGYFKFGGQVLPKQNNFAGIGATNNSAVGKGAHFDTPELGVRAQIQHLFAYATKLPLPEPPIDPRFSMVTRGIAPNWEDLNGRWAVPGTNYGQAILADFAKAAAFETPLPDKASPWAKDSWEKAFAESLCDGRRPKDPATREEVITLITKFIERAKKVL